MEQEKYTVNEYNRRMLGEETRTLGDLPGDDGEKRINIPEAEVNHGELWSRSLHRLEEEKG